MKKKSTLSSTLKPHHYATTALFCCSIMTPIMANAETEETKESETFRLSPILVNDYVEVDNDAESVVAKELWVGGKVATSIQDTPASVSVITEKEITERNASTTEEVLQYSPGLITDYYGTDDRNDYFKIRGFDATTYRDGLTLGSMRGVREDAYAFERVEVIRGANSTLFGPAEPGGSINFVSKRPKFEEFGNAYVTYGSNDHKEVGVDTGDTLDEDKTLAYRFTSKIKDSDREYDYSKDDSQLLMGGLTWEPTDDTSATLIVDYLKTDSTPNSGGYPLDKEYDRSDFFGEPDYNNHDVERTNITAQVSHDLNNGFKLRGNLRYSDATDDFGYVYLSDNANRTGTDVNRYYFASKTNAEQFVGNIVGQYDASFNRFDSSTLVGVEYQNASSTAASAYGSTSSININNVVYSGAPSSLNIYSNKKTDSLTRAAFLQQNFSFDDKYIVTLGARNDDIELTEVNYLTNTTTRNDFSENSFRSAFTYKFNDEVSAYISQVESVSPPSSGTEIVRGEQLEVGAKYSPNNMNAIFSVAVYDLTKNNVDVAIVQTNGSIEREIIGENRTKGVDLEVKAELTDSLSITGGYSYMDSKVVEDDNYEGNDFVAAPTHTASLWSHYTLPRQDMTVGLGARYLGSYYFDAANTAKSEAVVLFDASYGYDLTQQTTLSLNISNLLDKQYVVGSGTANYYNPGRNISLKLDHSW
ncbi:MULTISPECIES: TonB-dependent siderophore receptor [Marinomonas]|uniref:TonB-dependent siderophore receptor n=1 Tax=Marinomonas rhodophyticola TaxID=2992803 RepID=A0ABT3KGM4_9GAMM|nr:TonB-dependent siderophore receptor [Marinomonas sp. KJ51-3]MCW4629699.1 TonB-dependent siderophore receptor [Marinomonas sp. KJ51-3]